MKIAIISDLHIGQSARAKALSPYLDDGALDDGFLEALRELAASQQIVCDFLIIPGDITNTAHPAECNLAASVISDVAAFFAVRPANILAVPGNHDVSWSLPTAITTALTDGLPAFKKPEQLSNFANDSRYLPSGWRGSELSQLLGPRWHSLLTEPYFSVSNTNKAVIVTYNSAFSDGPNQRPHRGEAHQDHLLEIERAIAELGDTGNKPRIFVVHHHVHQHTGPDYTWVDFSIMHNADGLLRLLLNQRFDLLIHGHKHFPRFATHSTNGGHPLAILGAGSFSRALNRNEIEVLGNTFHIIDVQDRGPDAALRGNVKTWVFRHGHGWIASQRERHAIAHLRPFGCGWDDQTLRANLRTAIQALPREKQVVRIDSLTATLPDLEFADADRLEGAVADVASDLSLSLARDGEDPRTWILVRNE